MHRRRALRVLGTLAAIPALSTLTTGKLFALGRRVHQSLDDAAGGSAPRVLTAEQYRAVTVAAEHVIPRTDTPGASDARVADFVDVMLADWYPDADRSRFLAGLRDLDGRASRAHGKIFADAEPAQRVGLLTAIDHEVAALRARDAGRADEHWFAMLKFLTVWGYYTSRVGIEQELATPLVTGRYDGDAPYRPRRQTQRRLEQ
jgi:hypothetical protein